MCYVRLIQTILTNPGIVPRNAKWITQKSRLNSGSSATAGRHIRRRGTSTARGEKSRTVPGRSYENQDPVLVDVEKLDSHNAETDEFWKKDVFTCSADGRPAFCSSCLAFKPDRAHHCSEINRCVRKMDHFCPWIGGIISETSFKYFIQLTFYGALYCAHTFIFMAVLLAQRERGTTFINAHWIVVLALSALFFLFTAAMCGSSLQLAAVNSTTVENITRKTKVWYFCVYLPNPGETMRRIQAAGRPPLWTISYPRPPEERLEILQQNGVIPTSSSKPVPAPAPGPDPSRMEVTRTFAILATSPGTNPWSLGPLRNLQEVMGYQFVDWFLPIKPSPCTNHASAECSFKLGPAFYKLKREAGIDSLSEIGEPRRRRRRRTLSHSESRRGNEDEDVNERPDELSAQCSGEVRGGTASADDGGRPRRPSQYKRPRRHSSGQRRKSSDPG